MSGLPIFALAQPQPARQISLTRTIGLTFALISALVMIALGVSIDRMLEGALLRENSLLLLHNLSVVRDQLARAPKSAASASPQSMSSALQAFTHGFNGLDVAVLDRNRHIIAASDGYRVPDSTLPSQAIAIDAIPEHVDIAAKAALHRRFGQLSHEWSSPDERRYQYMLAQLRPDTAAAPGEEAVPAYVVLSYERSLPRDLVSTFCEELVVTLFIGVLVAGALGYATTHVVLNRVRRIAATARRISASALDQRLPLESVPLELTDTALAFNQMLERLEQSFKRLSDFSSDLAHDLRTPINNLLGEAQVALSRPRESAEYRAILESAVEEYERLSRMIENMLFLARTDDVQARLAPRWIDLRLALERVIAYYEVIAEERAIRLTLEIGAGPGMPPRVWADEMMLTRAIGNLLSNALRHSMRGAEILLRGAVQPDGAAEISVANQGEGIAPEHLPRVFDRFYRIEGARADSCSGSGLGLAIVKSIMELHGGRAAAQSRPDKLTVFSLHFPATQ